MSLINGDKSRAGRQRKTRFEKREKSRILRQSLAVNPGQPAPGSPVVAPSAGIAATVVAAAIPAVVAARISTKKPLMQYPKRNS